MHSSSDSSSNSNSYESFGGDLSEEAKISYINRKFRQCLKYLPSSFSDINLYHPMTPESNAYLGARPPHIRNPYTSNVEVYLPSEKAERPQRHHDEWRVAHEFLSFKEAKRDSNDPMDIFTALADRASADEKKTTTFQMTHTPYIMGSIIAVAHIFLAQRGLNEPSDQVRLECFLAGMVTAFGLLFLSTAQGAATNARRICGNDVRNEKYLKKHNIIDWLGIILDSSIKAAGMFYIFNLSQSAVDDLSTGFSDDLKTILAKGAPAYVGFSMLGGIVRKLCVSAIKRINLKARNIPCFLNPRVSKFSRLKNDFVWRPIKQTAKNSIPTAFEATLMPPLVLLMTSLNATGRFGRLNEGDNIILLESFFLWALIFVGCFLFRFFAFALAWLGSRLWEGWQSYRRHDYSMFIVETDDDSPTFPNNNRGSLLADIIPNYGTLASDTVTKNSSGNSD